MTWQTLALVGLGISAFSAFVFYACARVNAIDSRLDEESKKVKDKRLTLDAELEIAYWHHRRDND